MKKVVRVPVFVAEEGALGVAPKEEIEVDSDMLSPVLKLRAIAELFLLSVDSSKDLGEDGFYGVSKILDSISDEIMGTAHDLNDRINKSGERGIN